MEHIELSKTKKWRVKRGPGRVKSKAAGQKLELENALEETGVCAYAENP